MFQKWAAFCSKFMAVHVLSYFLAGAFFYQWLTKPFYQGQGAEAIFKTFMRTESEPLLWKHVMTWQIPGQILRGLLMGWALLPFLKVLRGWRYWKRVWVLFGIYFVFSHLSATGPTTGGIEGLIYLRPEIMNPRIFLAVQPEIILQALVLALGVSWWMIPKSERKVGTVFTHD